MFNKAVNSKNSGYFISDFMFSILQSLLRLLIEKIEIQIAY